MLKERTGDGEVKETRPHDSRRGQKDLNGCSEDVRFRSEEMQQLVTSASLLFGVWLENSKEFSFHFTNAEKKLVINVAP